MQKTGQSTGSSGTFKQQFYHYLLTLNAHNDEIVVLLLMQRQDHKHDVMTSPPNRYDVASAVVLVG